MYIPKTIEPALASSAAAPQTTTSSVAPLAQLSKNTGSGNNNSSVTATTTTNVHIVLRSQVERVHKDIIWFLELYVSGIYHPRRNNKQYQQLQYQQQQPMRLNLFPFRHPLQQANQVILILPKTTTTMLQIPIMKRTFIQRY
jgi:hypothetical protein